MKNKPRYRAVITQLERKRNHGMRYKIEVTRLSPRLDGKEEVYVGGFVGHDWTWTFWGAKRAANRIVKEATVEETPEKTQIVLVIDY